MRSSVSSKRTIAGKGATVAETDNKIILVVDDEDDVRRYLSMALEDAGFEVLTASDGEEALKVLSNHPVDLISLDLIMPRKSGVKLYRDLQKDKAWKKIPVLVVTGHIPIMIIEGIVTMVCVAFLKRLRPEIFNTVKSRFPWMNK
jgi:CheY-like chemotaxis protein